MSSAAAAGLLPGENPESNPRVVVGDNKAPEDQRIPIADLVANDPGIVLTDEERRAELFKYIEDEISAFAADVSTAKGRDEIASFAYQFTKTKTAVDGAGKSMNEAARAQINVVDAARRAVRTRIDELVEIARAPLTEWKRAEKERDEEADRLVALFQTESTVTLQDTAQSVRERGVKVWNTAIDADALGKRADEVKSAKQTAVATLKSALDRLTKEEADKAELARLREEAAEREAEAEAERRRIAYAKSVMEHIRQCGLGMIDGKTYPYVILIRELEEKVVIDESFGDLREEAEALRLDTLSRIKAAAEEQQRRHRLEAEEAAAEEARRKAEADKQAEIDAANERARQAEAAAQREREAAQRAEDERRQREADQAHRAKLKAEAVDAIVAIGVPKTKAEKVVQAVVAGDVPHLKMEF